MYHSARFVITVLAVASLTLTACGGGGSSGGGGGIFPTPFPTATSMPVSSSSAFACPTSTSSYGLVRSAQRGSIVRRAPSSASGFADRRLVVVTYTPANLASTTAVDARASAFGARVVQTVRFSALGTAAHVLAVEPAQADALAASLRSLPGVISAQPSMRARTLTVNAPYVTNDPYFRGGTGTAAPYYESASVPGQWDMHVIGLGDAFAYSQSSNGSGVYSPNALGSTSVKLAVIDTGADVTHPDLAGGSIALTRCFITDQNGVQSTGGYATDPDGHGTDVTGIAAATTGNGFGFAGAAGNVSLMLYRVFPTPDDTCASPTNSANDPQCGAADVDIASAIDDAVQNGANVINLSLGVGSGCVNGQDPSTIEGQAIANAIAHNVIVVAASGNGGTGVVGAPGCDPGVIAVGASALNDGAPNATSYTGPNQEYVASYSQYGATNVLKSATSWGIVAPGGDPLNGSDLDDLHWIENIWTSTPYMSSPTDTNFTGDCATDYFGEANDCRTLIAGTSMSTPHVAGAAALVLAVSGVGGRYDSPAAMKALLCSTADDIGDPHEGCGRLNVYRAVAAALGDPNLP